MKSYLVIDGYNLMHEIALSEGEFIHQDNLEEKRDDLIQEIANYKGLTDYETVLVFDALHSPSELSEEEISGITVVFTGKDETADTYIEKYLYTRPRNSNVVLVTSDAHIQEMAIFTGAQRISSRQFINEIIETKQVHKPYGEKDKDQGINKVSEHLEDETLKVLNTLRFGDSGKD